MTKGQKPTHKQVMQGYRLLRQHKIPVDILCVVHAQNVQYPLQVYRFFKEIKAQYISFIPLVERQSMAEGGVSPRTVPAEAFGTFLCAIFDEWVRHDIGRIIVQMFEEAARPAHGQDHSLCIFRPTCGMSRSLNTTGISIRAITLLPPSIAWAISAKPHSSNYSTVPRNTPLDRPSAIRYRAIVGNAKSGPCVTGMSERSHHPDPRR